MCQMEFSYKMNNCYLYIQHTKSQWLYCWALRLMLKDFAMHRLHPCLVAVLFFTAFASVLQHFLELYYQLWFSGIMWSHQQEHAHACTSYCKCMSQRSEDPLLGILFLKQTIKGTFLSSIDPQNSEKNTVNHCRCIFLK